ncbi:hypothetical protein HHI36_022021 [Cryptolaemus montrouzieri]|uniref:Uncharacterized protein n=1 Tax=Cryptolaemus montrouzieri TaxID=559131 RepID=A0ABD2MYR7_9CUCU
MFKSPQSLEELCLDGIAENIELYVEPVSKKTSWCIYLDSEERPERKYVFRDPGIFLIQQISEKLLSKLLEKGLLCDAILHIFSEQNTKLRSVRVANCKVSEYGLKILNNHKITELECINLRNISIPNIIDCLSDWSQANIVNVNFTRCTFIDTSRHSYMVKIVNLKNLRSLNLSYTELNQHCFTMICTDLQHLEKLDISGTPVKNLTPLLGLCKQIKSIGLAFSNQGDKHVLSLYKVYRQSIFDVQASASHSFIC